MNKNLIQTFGYRRDSPFRDLPFINIESDSIDMSNTDKELLLIPDKGTPKVAKPYSGMYTFPDAKVVREIPLKQQGGTSIMSGLAGESTVPVSPFIDLKPFIKKYKKQYGGVIDYMTSLPLEVQGEFAQDFDSLSKDEKDEVVKMMCGGKYQTGGYSLTVSDKTGSNVTQPINPQTIEDKNQVLKTYGVLPEQVANKTWLSNRIYKAVNPAADYTINPAVVNRVLTGENRFENQQKNIQTQVEKIKSNPNYAVVQELLSKYKQEIDDWNQEESLPKIAGETTPYFLDDMTKLDYLNMLRPERMSSDDIKKLDTLFSKENSSFIKELSSYRQTFANTFKRHGTISTERDGRSTREEEDAYRMYLGLPQEGDSFSVSQYTPSKSQNKNTTYYKMNDPNIAEEIKRLGKKLKVGETQILGYGSENDPTIKHIGAKDENFLHWTLGNFTISKGKDDKGEYISYYDLWDLAPGGMDVNFMGKPIEIYDRVYLDKKKKGGYYQTGGVSEYQTGGQPNAELEDGETLITPNQELSKVTGKKHSEGGEKVSLPTGTRIYSEYLKVPTEVASQVLGKETKKKYSYAQISKKFPTKPYMEIIEEDADDYKVEGAKVKLANNLAKLDTLFFAQEQEKASNDPDEFMYGGKYQQGGQTFEDYMMGRTNLPPSPGNSKWPTTVPFTQVNTITAAPLMQYIPPPGEQLGAFPYPLTEQIDEYALPEVVISDRSIKPIPKRKPVRNKSNPVPTPVEVGESNLWQVPPPLNTLPQRNPTLGSLGITQQEIVEEPSQYVADVIIESNDDQSYPGKPKRDWKFGISNKLAGTIADIGLALGDKLNVKEPTLYNRQKTPLFTRFVDFDDQDVARSFSLRSQQIQNSNIPEQVKQAQLSALNSEYQDYQAKVDFANLQRYEQKREGDTNKLQQYLDNNIDIKVEDTERYNEQKARVDYLRDKFRTNRKQRIVNALRGYADYVDEVNYKNQLIPNYKVNPITGRIDFKSQQESDLRNNLLSQYQQRSQPKIDLGMGATAQQIGDIIIITDKEGKVTTTKAN